MGKLFNLKEWLTVADAARHLSIVFGEEVTEADILRLALDSRLRLSVYLANEVVAKRAEMKSIPIEVKRMPGFTFTTDQILHVRADEIFYLDGVLDLPMIGSERLHIEDKYRSLLNGKVLEIVYRGDIYIEDGGQLYELQSRFADPVFVQLDESREHEEVQRQCAMQSYFSARSLPEDSTLVVRTEALRDFEQSIIGAPEITGRAHVSDRLAKMNQAAAKWWGNADRADRGTHPDNATVAAWLVQRGFSPTLASSAATIIRPEWVPTGRKPEE